MAEKNESELWRQTTVLIRADLFALATAQGIDIGRECNRALAERVGIVYHDPLPASAPQEPVIIAPNAAPGVRKTPAARPASAIINADDPRSPKAVKARKARAAEPASAGRVAPPAPVASAPTAPVRASAPAPEPVPEPAAAAAAPPRAGKNPRPVRGKETAPAKKKIEDPVKKFCSTMILRTDAPGAAVRKDEMYEIFGRWCRDHRVTTVPEKRSFSVALKNQFAFTEKVVAGSPSWTGVRVK